MHDTRKAALLGGAAALAALGLAAPPPARAALTLFSGFDAGIPAGGLRPNSDQAAAQFEAAAVALGPAPVITFEGAPTGAFTALPAAPGVTVTGTDENGHMQTVQDAPGSSVTVFQPLYGYNTTPGGSEYVQLLGGSGTFTFAQPVQSFGAYFTGLNHLGDQLTFNDGSAETVGIPGIPFIGGTAFVGFTDAGKSITSITVSLSEDLIGVDDVRYAPSVSAAPEPSEFAALGCVGLGLGGLLLRARRRSHAG